MTDFGARGRLGTLRPRSGPSRPEGRAYDPWHDARQNWPTVQVVIEPMVGDLLGEVRGEPPVIALRAGTSSAQRRCTLAHEIVHLERGVGDCGPWQAWEERRVHLEAARRLIPSEALRAAIRDLGGSEDLAALAGLLEVDMETIRLRIRSLSPAEDSLIRTSLTRVAGELWAVA